MHTNGSTTAKPAAGSSVGFCTDCGSLVATGAKFCSSCGNTLSLVTATPPQAITEVIAPPPVTPEPPVLATGGRGFPVKKIAIGATVLVLGAAGAAFATMKPADHSPETARASLHATKSQVSPVIVQLEQAERLSDLRAAGASAEQNVTAINGELGRLNDIAGKDAGRKATAVVGAERDLLKSIAQLKGLDPRHIGDWQGLRAQIANSVSGLQTAETGVASLGVVRTLAPAPATISSSLDASQKVVEHAERRLRSWRRAY